MYSAIIYIPAYEIMGGSQPKYLHSKKTLPDRTLPFLGLSSNIENNIILRDRNAFKKLKYFIVQLMPHGNKLKIII